MADDDQWRLMRQATRICAVPLMMGGAVALGCLAGVYLDRRFGCWPWATVSLTLAGVLGGGYQAYRLIMKALKD